MPSLAIERKRIIIPIVTAEHHKHPSWGTSSAFIDIDEGMPPRASIPVLAKAISDPRACTRDGSGLALRFDELAGVKSVFNLMKWVVFGDEDKKGSVIDHSGPARRSNNPYKLAKRKTA